MLKFASYNTNNGLNLSEVENKAFLLTFKEMKTGYPKGWMLIK